MLRHRTEALISLQEVSQALIAGDDLRKLALRITRYTAALCGADRAVLYVLQEDEIATVLASHGWDPARVVAICFEHAFPQIFTTLSLQGAQVVFNPSAVPVGYGYLQDVRIPARAQDNQIFVVAVNHVGREGDVAYCGRSQIANPRGEVVALAADDAEGVVKARLPLALIWDQRRQEPIFRGFRPELYEPRA